MDEKKYQLIVAFVNAGFTDLVMEAARAHGARGGTVNHARGTGTKAIEEKYGITISEDKEMVMILIDADLADEVLKAINDAAGLHTLGRGIAFALPVDAVAGLNKNIPTEQKDPKKPS